MDVKLFGAFGFGKFPQFRHIGVRAVTKSDGARVVGLDELNLKLPSIPSRLALVSVGVNHSEECSGSTQQRSRTLTLSFGE